MEDQGLSSKLIDRILMADRDGNVIEPHEFSKVRQEQIKEALRTMVCDVSMVISPDIEPYLYTDHEGVEHFDYALMSPSEIADHLAGVIEGWLVVAERDAMEQAAIAPGEGLDDHRELHTVGIMFSEVAGTLKMRQE